ncbi:hypothetical protein RDWZM_006058 [Blomia tropicalis]|uniref:Uncharacterized protein n=1 Tax=Blomia tropicalis TaxID=40697 RepID=A0A9Q0M6C5_BLOTA|nr:hypothetical protein RDWZM_006058 [Blomia tropicalis]
MIRFIIFLLFIASVYSESKPKWLEEKITETCSGSLKKGTIMEMNKTMDELCSIYKLMKVTIASERNLIMNCLLDDQWNNSDYICEKWWIEPNHTTTEVTTESELGLYQFAKLVKSAINRSEKCLYELSHNNSETCEFLAKYNETILFSFQRIIYQKLVQRDLLDQQVIEHCFLYHQLDDYHKCVGVSNATHINGFTMSNERRTRIRSLWKAFHENMLRCLEHFDKSNCIEKFDIKKVCKHSSKQDCIQVMMCKYTSSWKTISDHICYFISRANKFIPKIVCTEKNKGCIHVIYCKYSNSSQEHICQMNTDDGGIYMSPSITKMQHEFYILENNQAKEDCNSYHQQVDDGVCKKAEPKISVTLCSRTLEQTDNCPYCQENELDIVEHDFIMDSCILHSLWAETNSLERNIIINCLLDDGWRYSVNFCHKWWKETSIITQENLSEKEKAYYRFAAIVKKSINMAESCAYHQISEYCMVYFGYEETELRFLDLMISNLIIGRKNAEDRMVEHCFFNHQFHEDDQCIGLSNATHMEGFTMSNARKTRIIKKWDNLVQCVKNYTYFECLHHKLYPGLCDDLTNEECTQVRTCKYSNSWLSNPLDPCQVITKKIVDPTNVNPKIGKLINYYDFMLAIEEFDDCVIYHPDVNSAVCKRVIEREVERNDKKRLDLLSHSLNISFPIQ